MRSIIAAMFGIAVVSAGVALFLAPQDPKSTPPKPHAPAVVEWDDGQARDAVATLERAMRVRDAGLADRLRALDAVATGRHRLLVKPLAKVLYRDPAVSVRKRAAELIAQQPPETARPVLLAALRADDDADPAVLATVVRGLQHCYEPRDWEVVEKLFGRDFAPEFVPLQKAVLELVTTQKEKQAWKLLVEHLDPPIPDDVDGAANPPAEYWEKRWKAWTVWHDDVEKALFVVTGQRFSTGEEARQWIRAHGAEHGLR